MAAVYPEIRLTWRGRAYLVKVTMALLNRLEQNFSLARLAHRISTGDTPLSHLAVMVGEMLRSEGADVTDDEVLAELLTGDTEAVQQMAVAIITAAFPVTAAEAAAGGSAGEGKPKAAARRRSR